MVLISGFFKRLFGKKNEQTKVENYMDSWGKERQQRIVNAEARLKDFIVSSLKEKGKLTFSWESGHDEAFVTFDDKDDSKEDDFFDLEEYIVYKLDIPDAGEFQMNGNGTLYIQDNFVRAKYSSTMKETIDYNEDTDEEIFDEEIVESNDISLFPL